MEGAGGFFCFVLLQGDGREAGKYEIWLGERWCTREPGGEGQGPGSRRPAKFPIINSPDVIQVS